MQSTFTLATLFEKAFGIQVANHLRSCRKIFWSMHKNQLSNAYVDFTSCNTSLRLCNLYTLARDDSSKLSRPWMILPKPTIRENYIDPRKFRHNPKLITEKKSLHNLTFLLHSVTPQQKTLSKTVQFNHQRICRRNY